MNPSLSVNESVSQVSLSHTNMKCNWWHDSSKSNRNATKREAKIEEWQQIE